MNVLTQRLHLATVANKSAIEIKICPRVEKISFLLFVDDCLRFCKSNVETCCKFHILLTQFCSQFGQLIKFLKSILVFSRNATSLTKSTVATMFNIPHRESLGKYLGCPFSRGKALSNLFSGVFV